MALNQNELWIKLKADMTHLRAGLATAKSEIKGFSSNLVNASGAMKKMGVSTTVLAGALALLQGMMIKTFAQFEQSMANTFSVLGAGSDSMREMTAYAREMGETTIFTASQAADAMYYLASAGYDAQKSMAALKGTLDLAAATQYDLAETTRLVVTAINSYGLSADEATRVSNVFSAIISSSQATMERLGESFKYVAPIAATLGISLEQTAASLGALYNAGLAASQAGTYLRQGLVRLQKPTRQALEGMHALGLTVEDLNPQTNDLIDILSALERAGAGAKDAGDEMAKIFGVRAATAFQILVRNGGEALSVLEGKITGTNKSAEMAEIQINTLQGSFKLLKSVIQETAIQFGERLAPAIRAAADTVKNIFKWFNSLPSPIKDIIVGVTAMATILGLLAGPIGILLSFLPKIIVGLKLIGATIMTTTGAIGIAVVGLVALITYLGGVGNAATKANEAITNNIKSLKEFVSGQISQKEKQKELIDSYLELANKTDKTVKEQDKQKQKMAQIKALYPDLISDTDDLRTATNKLTIASREINIQLEELYKKQKKLRDLELRIEISKAKDDLRELEKELKDTDINLFETAKNIFARSGDSLGSNIASIFLGIGQSITKEQLEALAATDEGIEKLISGMDELQTEIDMAKEKSVELDAKIGELKTSKDDLTDSDKERIGVLENEKQLMLDHQTASENMKGYYNDALEKGKQRLALESKILEKEVEREKLDKPEEKVDPLDLGGYDRFEDEEDLTKRINAMRWELEKQFLEAQAAMLEEARKKDVGAAFKYANIQNQIREKQLAYEKNLALQEAEELGISRLEVEKSYAEKSKEIEQQKFEDYEDIESWFLDRDIDFQLNRLSLLRGLNEQDLKNFRELLVKKLKQTETWGEDYVKILKKIKQVEEEIMAFQENKIKLRLEMTGQEDVFGDLDEARYVDALERHQEYLMKRMEQETTYSDEWMSLQQQMMDNQQEIYAANLEIIKERHGWAIEGMMGGFNHLWQRYIIGGRQAKNEMDAVWLAIRNSALKAIQDILQAEMTKMFLKIIAKVAGLAIGGPAAIGASAIGTMSGFNPVGETLGMGNAPSAAIGAHVERSGVAKVHAGETIMPAHISRLSYGGHSGNSWTFDRAIEKMMNNMKNYGNVEGQRANYVFVNPMVDDDNFWLNIVEERMRKADEELRKRYGNL